MITEYTFTFSDKDTQEIFEALIERPYKQVAHIINNFQMQVQRQQTPQEEPKDNEADKG